MNGFKKSPSLDSVLSYFVLRTNDILELSVDRFTSEEKSAGPKGKELAISDLRLFDTAEKPSFFIIRAGAGRAFTGAATFVGAAATAFVGAAATAFVGAAAATGAAAFIGAAAATGAGAGACITTGAGGGAGAGAGAGACITTGAGGGGGAGACITTGAGAATTGGGAFVTTGGGAAATQSVLIDSGETSVQLVGLGGG